MDFSAAVLGKATVTALQGRLSQPVLVIGSDRFTRHDLSQVDCFNFIAAANLNQALKDLGIKNTRDLYTNYAPSVLALPRIGPIALAVIGAALEAKGLGGSHPLESWMAKHSETHEAGIRHIPHPETPRTTGAAPRTNRRETAQAVAQESGTRASGPTAPHPLGSR